MSINRRTFGGLSCLLPLVIFVGPAKAVNFHQVKLRADVVNGQVENGSIWSSETISFGNQLLSADDLFEIIVVFENERSIKVTDTLPSTNESIGFLIGDSGGVGGSPPLFHNLVYSWIFTGVEGKLDEDAKLINGRGEEVGQLGSLTGNGTTNGASPRKIELTNSSFTFTGINLRVWVPETLKGTTWNPGSVRFHVDGDGIEVLNKDGTRAPVPGPLPLLGLGVAFSYTRKLRKRIQAGSLPNEKIAKAYSQK